MAEIETYVEKLSNGNADQTESSVIDIGSEIYRWRVLSQQLVMNDKTIAKYLLDVYEKHVNNSTPITSNERNQEDVEPLNATSETTEISSLKQEDDTALETDSLKNNGKEEMDTEEVHVKVERQEYHSDDELTSDYTEEVEEILKAQNRKKRKLKTLKKEKVVSKKRKVNMKGLQPIKLKLKQEAGRKRKAEEKKKRIERGKTTAEKPTEKKKTPKKETEPKPWIKISLDQHAEKFTVEKINSIERQHRKSSVFEFMYSCLICYNFKAENRDIFEIHVEKHLNNILKCPTCNYEAYSEFDLTRHKKLCNPDVSKMFICDMCGEIFNKRDAYRCHLGKVHGIHHWKCRYCEERFPTRFNYQSHMKKEHPEQMNFCQKCNQYFPNLSKDEYNDHTNTCKGEFQCPECGKMFLGKMVLATHVRYIHKNIRSHQCHICPYSAKSASMLRLHIRAHEGIHPYSCDQCTFTCVQRYQLKSHMRTHTKEKPYKCTMCSYAAAWNVQLKEHIKAHSMSTAVACRECGVVLKNTHTLSIHEKKEHGSVWQYNHPPNIHPLALTAPSATAPHAQQHPAVMGQ